MKPIRKQRCGCFSCGKCKSHHDMRDGAEKCCTKVKSELCSCGKCTGADKLRRKEIDIISKMQTLNNKHLDLIFELAKEKVALERQIESINKRFK